MYFEELKGIRDGVKFRRQCWADYQFYYFKDDKFYDRDGSEIQPFYGIGANDWEYYKEPEPNQKWYRARVFLGKKNGQPVFNANGYFGTSKEIAAHFIGVPVDQIIEWDEVII